jgi:hypothetical protein
MYDANNFPHNQTRDESGSRELSAFEDPSFL